MDKQAFLEQLKLELIKYGEKEYESFLSNYDELIEDYLEDGLSYQEIFSKIGSPEEIAKKLVSVEHGSEQFAFSKQSKSTKTLIMSLLILGSPLWACLLSSAMILLLSVYIIIWCIPFMLGTFSFAGLFGGLVSLILSPFCLQDGLHIFIMQLGIGMIGSGLGVLLGFATLSVSRVFVEKTKQFTDLLMNPLKGKGVIIYEK